MYKLKSVNNRVNSVLRTGKDFVSVRIETVTAQRIIDEGTIVESSKEGYPICIDNKWYFEGEEIIAPVETVETVETVAPRKGKGKKA